MPVKNETSYTGNPGYSPTIMNASIAYNSILFMNGAGFGASKVSDKVDTGFNPTNPNDTGYGNEAKTPTGFTGTSKQTTGYEKP